MRCFASHEEHPRFNNSSGIDAHTHSAVPSILPPPTPPHLHCAPLLCSPLFPKAVAKHGSEWVAVAQAVGTRDKLQVYKHAARVLNKDLSPKTAAPKPTTTTAPAKQGGENGTHLVLVFGVVGVSREVARLEEPDFSATNRSDLGKDQAGARRALPGPPPLHYRV